MALPRTVAVCSFRLGGTDGVSIEAAKWVEALRALGCAVTTVAGSGTADHLVTGLAIGDASPVDKAALERGLRGAELVVVENLCSLPLNPAAARAVASVLAGRRALLRHHDLALERPAFAHFGPPPDDPSWIHVCVNRAAVELLAGAGIRAELCYNAFDTSPALVERAHARRTVGLSNSARVVLQPTRAIPRKNVPAGLRLAEALGATYWLTGPAEDGYGPTLARILAGARSPVLHRSVPEIALAYGACDLVVMPSDLEGFGNPAIEAVTHLRPVAVGDYPVARELRELGLRFLDVHDFDAVAAELVRPDPTLIADNLAVARTTFSLADLAARLEGLLLANG